MIIPTLTVEAYISGSWVDLSSDLVRSMKCSRGIMGNTVTERIAKEGTLVFYLNNSASNSVSTLGYYSLSHASKLAGWTRGIKVRVKLAHSSYASGAAQEIFYGRISKIEVVPGQFRERSVKVTCVDYMAELNDWDQIPQTTVLQEAASYQAYQQVIDEMNNQPEGTNFVDEYIEFDGSTSTIDCGDTAELTDLHGGAFTCEGWFRADNAGESSTGYFFGKGSATAGGWRLSFNSAATSILLQADFATTDINEAITVSNLADGSWHHVAVTFDFDGDKKMYLYIDGALAGSTAAGAGAANTDSGNSFRIGSRFNGALSFDGGIGWVRVSDAVRYTTTFDPKTYTVQPPVDTDTVSLWRMTEGTGTSVVDFVGTSDGTITDGTWTDKRNSLDILTYIYQRSGQSSGTAYQEFNRIAVSVFDFIFVTGPGVLTSQNREVRLNDTTVQFTLNAELLDISHTDDRDRAVDRVISVTYPVEISTGQSDTVYTLQNPIRLNPSESKTITCRYTDSNSSRNVGLLNPVALVADTHYKFGSAGDELSNDMNAFLGTSITYGAGAADVTVTNNANGVGYVNALTLVGNAVKFFDPVETIKQITSGKNKTIRMDMPYQESEAFASAANNMIENVYATTVQVNSAQYNVNKNTTSISNFFLGEIGKRIAVTETMTGLSATEAFINGVDWNIKPGNIIDVTYSLAPARDTSDRMIVGVSTVGSGVVYFSGG